MKCVIITVKLVTELMTGIVILVTLVTSYITLSHLNGDVCTHVQTVTTITLKLGIVKPVTVTVKLVMVQTTTTVLLVMPTNTCTSNLVMEIVQQELIIILNL